MSSENNHDYEDDFLNDIQNYEYNEMVEKARNVVLGFTGTTAVTGAVPIPFADAPLLIAQQVTMMAAINKVFGFDIGKDALKSLAAAAIGVGGATVMGKAAVSNLLKLIPGVGSVAGGAISAGTAGVITLALGNAYIGVCKAIKMGDLNQNDLTKEAGKNLLKKKFKEELKKKKTPSDYSDYNEESGAKSYAENEQKAEREEPKFVLEVLKIKPLESYGLPIEVKVISGQINTYDKCAITRRATDSEETDNLSKALGRVIMRIHNTFQLMVVDEDKEKGTAEIVLTGGSGSGYSSLQVGDYIEYIET